MTRIVSALLILLFLVLAPSTLAQDSPTLSGEEGLGLPELQITVTDDGWDAPSEIAAGRYLVTATYEGDNDFGTAAFLNIPSDWTIDDLNERLAAGAAAAPEQFSDGTTVNHTVPSMDWLYQLTTAGGVSPVAGGTAQGIVDLFPGNWAIWSDGFTPAAIPLTVTGEMPVALPEPSSAVTVTGTSDGDTFDFTIDGSFSPGTQVVKVMNSTDQPQFLEIFQLSSLVTGAAEGLLPGVRRRNSRPRFGVAGRLRSLAHTKLCGDPVSRNHAMDGRHDHAVPTRWVAGSPTPSTTTNRTPSAE